MTDTDLSDDASEQRADRWRRVLYRERDNAQATLEGYQAASRSTLSELQEGLVDA